MNTSLRRHACLVALAVVAAAASVPALAQISSVELVRNSKPSLVAVGVFNPTAAPRFNFRGSGFVVDDGRTVVTNAHVLVPPSQMAFGTRLEVRLPGTGGELAAREAAIVAVDPNRDVALLRIAGEPLPALPLASPELAPEGLPVLFMGFPIGGVLGFAPVSHRGMVSSITQAAIPSPNAGRLAPAAVAALRDGSFPIYQLDATAYPGNSGGPVIDADTGRVVAVISMVLVKGTRESALSNPSGISYAVPVRFVHELLRQR
jgi:S1-C subfamily serine protease